MSAAVMHEPSLRLERAESSRLAWAFGISLAIHLVFFGGYQTGKRFGWWQNFQWPAWLQPARMLSELLRPKESPPRQQPKEAPLMFVDVSSAQQTPEAPKKADYYSDKNSKAANLEPPVDSTVPKITGDQTQIVKTEDVPRSKAFPLNPAQPAEHSEPKEEAKPKPAYTPGDLTMAKPEDMTRKEEGTAERARPRTLQEARARQSENRLAGKEM